MDDKFKWSAPDDAATWWPPVYEEALEMPADVMSLTTADDRIFAHLADGRTVNITSLTTREQSS